MTLAAPRTTKWTPTWRTRSAFWWVTLSALVIAVFSPLQFASRLRTRRTLVHRAVGRVVVGSTVLAGTAGLVLAPHDLAGRR